MFGKKRKTDNYYNDRNSFLAESEYVDIANKLILRICSAKSRFELDSTGRELNRIIREAIADQTPNRDLITIEQMITQNMYISDWSDQQSGGSDALLQRRISILRKAYEYLDSSF